MKEEVFDKQRFAAQRLKEAETQYEKNTGVKGSDTNGAKITAMLKEIIDIRAKDDDKGNGSKIIVFSTWPEFLDRVRDGLRRNNIACAYPSGTDEDGALNDPNEELDHFKTSRTTFVLLLLVDEGAEGLDLTQANYVFISSPVENYAKEAQMKARVMRLGQSRPTVVKHFVVENTIEESIYRRGRDQMKLFEQHSGEQPSMRSAEGAFSTQDIDEFMRTEFARLQASHRVTE